MVGLGPWRQGERMEGKEEASVKRLDYMPLGRLPALLLPNLASFSHRGHEPVLVACSGQDPIISLAGV